MTDWDRDAVRSRYGHVLQSEAWGQLRSTQGWRPEQVRIGDPLPVALVLWRDLPLGQRIAYVPRGPVFDRDDPAQLDAALAALAALARERKAIFLKVDPEIPVDRADLLAVYARHGFRRSRQDVQPVLATLEVDLSRDEDEILGSFDKDTRWSVRTAERRGVRVHDVADDEALAAVAGLYQETGRRAEFITRPESYYTSVWRALIDAGHATLSAALVEDAVVAGAVVFWCGDRALYMYGASGEAARKTFAAYAVQWHCLRAAKARGCARYDLGGVPLAEDPKDPQHGLYLFKKGFGGERREFAGAYDTAPGRARYEIWLALEPRVYTALGLARGRRPTMPVVR
jgi:lipid II:glycine glycyltransferase (peptidoglycan interpeptide bridge formation enzyme)